ncbi:MAG TPA: hypothetical protein VIX91_02805 [Candidatus Acidoferrum sp.]
MSVGLYLLEKFSSPVQDPDRLLQQMAAWVHQNYSDVLPRTRQDFVETSPTLFCQLHPAAEELELSLIDLEHLTASANTSTVGPGFHIFVCSLLQAWARNFQASWLTPEETSEDYGDEAEYYFSGEFTAAPSVQTFESKRQGILQSWPESLHEDEGYILEASIQEKVRESGGHYFVLNLRTSVLPRGRRAPYF